MKNYMEIKIPSCSENEAVARGAIASFVLNLDPTIDQLNDIKTAVSEAVTNSIVHGYKNRSDGEVVIFAEQDNKEVTVKITDTGVGIADVEKARQPFYTTASNDERSGMGFTVMETFMDSLEIISRVNGGTEIILKKVF